MAIRFDSLGINLPYVPQSIVIMGYEISILGILLAFSMILGTAFVVLEAKRRNQNQDFYLGAICMAVVGAVIGGRLFYVGFSWNFFKNNLWEILRLRNGGMAYYGALIGGVLMVALFCKIKKVSFGETADTLTIGILQVHIFTRLGDFFNRESYGQFTDWPTAMQLPLASVRSSDVTSMMRENLLTIDGNSWISVHPTFLYECVWCFLILFILLMIRRKKLFSGEIFLRYLAWYGLGRVFIEYLRTDQLWIPETTYPINMILAAAAFVLFTISVSVSRTMARKRADAKKRREQEFEVHRAAIEKEQPVDIEELLREEEEYQKSLENPKAEDSEEMQAKDSEEDMSAEEGTEEDFDDTAEEGTEEDSDDTAEEGTEEDSGDTADEGIEEDSDDTAEEERDENFEDLAEEESEVLSGDVSDEGENEASEDAEENLKIVLEETDETNSEEKAVIIDDHFEDSILPENVLHEGIDEVDPEEMFTLSEEQEAAFRKSVQKAMEEKEQESFLEESIPIKTLKTNEAEEAEAALILEENHFPVVSNLDETENEITEDELPDDIPDAETDEPVKIEF